MKLTLCHPLTIPHLRCLDDDPTHIFHRAPVAYTADPAVLANLWFQLQNKPQRQSFRVRTSIVLATAESFRCFTRCRC